MERTRPSDAAFDAWLSKDREAFQKALDDDVDMMYEIGEKYLKFMECMPVWSKGSKMIRKTLELMNDNTDSSSCDNPSNPRYFDRMEAAFMFIAYKSRP